MHTIRKRNLSFHEEKVVLATKNTGRNTCFYAPYPMVGLVLTLSALLLASLRVFIVTLNFLLHLTFFFIGLKNKRTNFFPQLSRYVLLVLQALDILLKYCCLGPDYTHCAVTEAGLHDMLCHWAALEQGI